MLLNSVMLSVLPSATHKLPLWSTATPARLTKWPCGVVLPSIVASKVPLASNFRTTLGPASPTYTSPFDGPPELSTAMLVGLDNWPAPEAAMKVPVASNFCTRLLPLSATYTSPVQIGRAHV